MTESTELRALEKLSNLLTIDDVDYQIYTGNPQGFIKDVLDITLWSRQEEIVQSIIDNRFTAVESGFGVGKCCQIDENLYLADGSVEKAGNLIGKSFNIIGFDPSNWSMRPMRAYATDNGEERCYEVVTKTGRHIARTGNHPLLTWEGWKPIAELKEGDRIAIPLSLPVSGTAAPFTRSEIKLLAYLIAEGSLKYEQAGFSQSEGKVLDEAREIANEFDCHLRRSKSNNATFYFTSNSEKRINCHRVNNVLNFIRNNGLGNKGSWDKFVPPGIFRMSNANIALFLNRLFACDGWVCASKTGKNRVEVGYCSVSYQLIQDVATLLLRLGIPVVTRKKYIRAFNTYAWNIGIHSSKSVKQFLDIVGYPLGKEEQSEHAYNVAIKMLASRDHYASDYDCLSKGAWEGLEHEFYKHDGLRENGLRVCKNNRLSRMLVKRYEKIRGVSLFNGWSDSDIGWDSVIEINDIGIQKTVAVSVPETQAYVTNVIDHNSLCAAMLTCWWLTTYEEEGIVITLAPTWQQVASIVWRYIRHMSRKSKLPGVVFDTPRWDISANRYGIGLSPRKATKEDMATLQGYHSKNLLVIMDEAGGLPKTMFEGVVSLCVGDNNRIAAIGNPIEKSGPFYDACNSKTWHHIRISCLEHPNVVQNKEIIPGAVSRVWVEDMIRDHCNPYKDPNFAIEVTNAMSDMELEGVCPPGAFVWNRVIYVPNGVFEAKVLGRPPDEASDQLIALSWVEAAKQWDYLSEGERILGLDPARYGGDYATMALRQGNKVHWVKRKRPITSDPSGELAGWLKVEMDRLGYGCWGFIDEIGIGAGVLDNAKRIGLNVRGVSFSKRARQNRRFANTRAELWWRVREKLQKHELGLPDDDMLAGDLTAPKFSYDDLGRVLIEDKDDIRKRIGRSTDSGDALALTFAVPSLDAVNEDGYDQEALTEQGSRWYMSVKPEGSRWRTPSSRSRFHRR